VTEHVTDEQLSLLLDGELSLTSREAVMHHVAGCPGCAARHDALVELIAALRLQPELAWTRAETARTLERLHGRPLRRDRAVTVSLLLAAAGVIAILSVLVLSAESRVVSSAFGALVSLALGGLALTSPRALIVLGVVAFLGLLAYPLAHSR
jgi:anti-sigma factor RsiW